MLPIFTTEQVRDGIDSGDLLIDLSDYIKKKDAATKTDIESLTAVIAGKLDATPQHKHDISNVKDLQEELDSKYDTSKKYPHNVILSDTEKISYLEAPKIELLELVKNKESEGYKFYVDESNGDLMITLDGVLVGSYSIAAGKWSWQADDNYAESDHNHDERYSLAGHNHDERYSLASHNHDDKYADKSHNHDTKYAEVGHIHSEYLTELPDHNHDAKYSDINHNHDNKYADKSHNHDTKYAEVGHNHDERYSLVSHNHDDKYAEVGHTHNTINNALTVTGDLTVKGNTSVTGTLNCGPINNRMQLGDNYLRYWKENLAEGQTISFQLGKNNGGTSDTASCFWQEFKYPNEISYRFFPGYTMLKFYNTGRRIDLCGETKIVYGGLTVDDSLETNASQTKISSQETLINSSITTTGGQLDVGGTVSSKGLTINSTDGTLAKLFTSADAGNIYFGKSTANGEGAFIEYNKTYNQVSFGLRGSGTRIYYNPSTTKIYGNLEAVGKLTVGGALTATSIESNSITANGIDVSTKITQMEAILQNHYQALLQLCQNHGMIDSDTTDGSNITATEGTVSIPSTVEMYQDLYYLRYELALASKVKTLPCFFRLHHHEDVNLGHVGMSTASNSDNVFIYCDFIPQSIKGKFTFTGPSRDWESKTSLNTGTYTRHLWLYTPEMRLETDVVRYGWQVYYEIDRNPEGEDDRNEGPGYIFRPDKAKTGHDYAYVRLAQYWINDSTRAEKTWFDTDNLGRFIGTEGAFTLTWEPIV